MNRHFISRKNHSSSEDIIPAFLTPDHLIKTNANQTNNKPQPNIIEIIGDNVASQNEVEISDFIIRESLHRAIAYENIDLFMQPVVTLPQRHVQFYEFYGRLRAKPGVYLPASDYMKMASEEHIISSLDRVFLMNCLKVIQKLRHRGATSLSYFINIKPFTLRDNGFMHALLSLLSNHKDIASALIFEMRYNDFVMLSPAEKKIIGGIAQIGCRFSLDHVDEIPTDFRYLRENNVSFLKVNAEMIIREGRTERGFVNILRKKQNLDVNNIDLIIEKTENENDLKELLDYDFKYGQGYLFGRPDFQGAYVNSTAQ